MSEETVTLQKQREIEAKIVGPLFRAFAQEVGEARAREILAGVVHDLAHEAGCRAAEQAGGDGLLQLGGVLDRWRQGEALTIDVLRHDAEALDFNVTRCRFAEMYRALGLEELGAILSCGRDAAMIEGFNPDIAFRRTQTLLGGATHCDFRYRKKQA
jgi:hypothetical protein